MLRISAGLSPVRKLHTAPGGFLLPTHPVGSLGRLMRPNSWPVLRVACAALPSPTNPATAIRVASVFTREATPATAKPHLSNSKNTGRLVIAHRPTTARSFAVAEQETIVEGASGACALSPSRPLIAFFRGPRHGLQSQEKDFGQHGSLRECKAFYHPLSVFSARTFKRKGEKIASSPLAVSGSV
jgi:hypothetical protein